MEEAKELQLSITDHEESNEPNTNGHTSSNQTPRPKKPRTLKWWAKIAVYSVFLLAGQAAATLLGRLYFEKGGDSKWMATVVQVAGFPILLPYYLMIVISRNDKAKKTATTITTTTAAKQPRSKRVIVSFYIVLGLFIAFDCYLYSVGLMYIPVSTYSLICASQLAFNAFFSYFINKQKFTPYIINSLVLLTVSSVLLVFNSDDDDSGGTRKVSRGKYAVGFVCTVAASAGYGLALSLTQYFIANVLRRDDFKVILDVTLWQSVVASLATVVGLFASGEWARIGAEMEGFQMGQVSYVMNLAWTAVTWQLFSVGNNGLILEVSALFSNVIGVLGLPVVPVFAVFFFGEKMSGLKAISMGLAVWGFVSYAYQNYLDGQVISTTPEENGARETPGNRERDE